MAWSFFAVVGYVNAFWQKQLVEYSQYNNTHPNNQIPVHPNIVVSDITFSHSPSSTQKPFSDGIWIKAYNGASAGHWMAWYNPPGVTPHWQHNELNVLNKNYVDLVCSQRP